MAREAPEAEEGAGPGPDLAPGAEAPKGGEDAGGARLWPVLITVGLILVVLVNALFIYIAVKGADEVVPSYVTEER